ncbi:MAG: ornithine carbamoyltransferase [Chlamydiae bacterium]|nr:ornithine carbamoyltransferase [Chlamydiota bacterium]
MLMQVKKDFIDIQDWNEKEILELLELSGRLKARPIQPLLIGKTLGMIFKKSSTRTRVSFEVGISQLGGSSIFLSEDDLQLGRGESLEDTARVLSRYLDSLVIRTYEHREVEEFARHATIPVINGLTDETHPCQMICDLFTIFERRQQLKGLKVVYVGDGANNVAQTWLFGAALMGMKLSVAAPPAYWPKSEAVRSAVKLSCEGPRFFEATQDAVSAVRDADVIYTDVWVSMGQEKEKEKRLKDLAGYQVNEALVKAAPREVLVMHCLPAHRGEEISAGVMDADHSIIFDQAENRLHTQKALMVKLMENRIQNPESRIQESE